MASDRGPSVPLAAPWTIRASTNCSGVSARVSSTSPRAKTAIDQRKVALRPNRPASQRVIGVTTRLPAI
jgi:hypothetical protein